MRILPSAGRRRFAALAVSPQQRGRGAAFRSHSSLCRGTCVGEPAVLVEGGARSPGSALSGNSYDARRGPVATSLLRALENPPVLVGATRGIMVQGRVRAGRGRSRPASILRCRSPVVTPGGRRHRARARAGVESAAFAWRGAPTPASGKEQSRDPMPRIEKAVRRVRPVRRHAALNGATVHAADIKGRYRARPLRPVLRARCRGARRFGAGGIEKLGGKLGSRRVHPQRLPAVTRNDQPARRPLPAARRHRDFFTGLIGSNVALAVGPALFAAKGAPTCRPTWA